MSLSIPPSPRSAIPLQYQDGCLWERNMLVSATLRSFLDIQWRQFRTWASVHMVLRAWQSTTFLAVYWGISKRISFAMHLPLHLKNWTLLKNKSSRILIEERYEGQIVWQTSILQLRGRTNGHSSTKAKMKRLLENDDQNSFTYHFHKALDLFINETNFICFSAWYCIYACPGEESSQVLITWTASTSICTPDRRQMDFVLIVVQTARTYTVISITVAPNRISQLPMCG